MLRNSLLQNKLINPVFGATTAAAMAKLPAVADGNPALNFS